MWPALDSARARPFSRTPRFTWTWVCWDGSRECLSASPSPPSSPSPHSHGPAVVVQVHQRGSSDWVLIYPLSCCSPRSDDSPLSSLPDPSTPPFTPPPSTHAVRLEVVSLPMARYLGTCPGAARPRFWAPRDQGRPRGLLQVRDLMVCVSPPGPSGWIHIDPAVMQQAIADNIILPRPPPAAAGPFFLFILSHQGHTCGYLQPSRRCCVCVPFFLFSSRSLTPSLFHLTN
jgi:hypothetical protein